MKAHPMSMRAKLSRLFGEFDLFHPSATEAPSPPRVRVADPAAGAELRAHTSDAGTSPLRLVPEPADGLAAPGTDSPGAASQPISAVDREFLAALRTVLVDAVAVIDLIDVPHRTLHGPVPTDSR